MGYSEFTQEDYELIARDYAELKEIVRKRCANEAELEIVQKAFELANQAHKNVRRRSGKPYMLHPIAVARIVVENIGLGYKSIAAALLHDVVEDTDVSLEEIQNLFGEKIASLVQGLTKISTVLGNKDKNELSYSKSYQAENLKKILLTMNDDVRVVLIKLADRLHNCRTIEFMPEHKRDKILSETMFIFIPLAHRLGLYEIKSEMENIWLRYLEPDAYNDITTRINQDLRDKEAEINHFIAPIEKKLSEQGFKFSIKKRLKSPYSIWNKMKSKGISYEQIFDIYAVRIIIEDSFANYNQEKKTCYNIYSSITSLYTSKPDRFRDWVTRPKNNGYEALHCTLMSNTGIWIEVQIRTKRMDDIAEKGIAAHWNYKKDGYISGDSDNVLDRWLNKVKEILVSEDVNASELLDIIHEDLTSYDIVVFTPKGDEKNIQKGATALDFAYQIHSEIGKKAIAAKANMKLVPLSYVLASGDQIEIITARDERPKKEWLSFLITRHARSKVIDFFRKNFNSIVDEGKKDLEKILHRRDVKLSPKLAKYLAFDFSLPNSDELFFRYWLGLIPTSTIIEYACTINNQDRITELDLEKIKKEKFIISNDAYDPRGYTYILSECCSPIPGDQVIGFINTDLSIRVHKKSCIVAEKLAAKHGEFIVLPIWDSAIKSVFQVRLILQGIDRMGMLNRITEVISINLAMSIKALNLGASEGIFEGSIDLLVHDTSALDKLISELKDIEGIQTVLRTEI